MTVRGHAAVALATVAMLALAGCGASDPAPTAAPTIPTGVPGRFNTPATLTSFRYTVEIVTTSELVDTSQAPPGLDLEDAVLNIRIDGERVNPDREYTHAVTTFGYLSVERETIVVGTRLWSRQENNAWRERATINGPEDFIGQDVALSPSVILGTDDAEYLQELTDRLEGQASTAETVNGRQTRHWVLAQAEMDWIAGGEFNTIPGLLPPESMQIEVWTDIETGVAVRVVLSAASPNDPDAFLLTMDLYDINDPGIIVTEPAVSIGP